MYEDDIERDKLSLTSMHMCIGLHKCHRYSSFRAVSIHSLRLCVGSQDVTRA